MKNIIISALLIASLTASVCVSAETREYKNKKEKEVKEEVVQTDITFRNLPWGITFKSFKDNLSGDYNWWNDEIDEETLWMYQDTPTVYYYFSYLPTALGLTTNISTNIYDKYIIPSGEEVCTYHLSVAGYDSNASLFFIKDINEDGTLNENRDDEFFYMGKYCISHYDDSEGVYTDLRDKLVSIYGVPFYEEKSYEICHWVDSNNNNLTLKNWGSEVYIYYMIAPEIIQPHMDKVDKLIKEEVKAKEALDREKEKENTSGL